ncbi:hypothetical protein [Streptomyces camponoticapitis]|uniref:hypothetical protein n=1 Tax=Streptomyces camponoticapitis TaxID=1616125 RepID=UPI00166BD867|nr:hypothetical protein [Streptomyces camponoticapitis]
MSMPPCQSSAAGTFLARHLGEDVTGEVLAAVGHAGSKAPYRPLVVILPTGTPDRTRL